MQNYTITFFLSALICASIIVGFYHLYSDYAKSKCPLNPSEPDTASKREKKTNSDENEKSTNRLKKSVKKTTKKKTKKPKKKD